MDEKRPQAYINLIEQLLICADDDEINKYLSKINYTYLTPSCLLPLAFCLSLLGN